MLTLHSLTELNNANQINWTDLQTCVGMNSNPWSAELYGITCTNIEYSSNSVELIDSTSQYIFDSLLHQDNKISFSDWDGNAWVNVESETFWNLIDNSVVSADDSVEIHFDVVEGTEYTVSVIIQPQRSEILAPGNIYVFHVLYIYIYILLCFLAFVL